MQKTSENVFLRHLQHLFLGLHSIMEGSPDTFFNFQFKHYATSKIELCDTTGITGNSWKLLLTVATELCLNTTNLSNRFKVNKVSKYLFANEKKIYIEMKYITETKYINFVN